MLIDYLILVNAITGKWPAGMTICADMYKTGYIYIY